MKTYKTIYKQTQTGATQIWYQEQDGSKYRTVSGQLNGKLVTSDWKQAEATNVGRANERNPEQQAEFEIEADYTKKLERDYHEQLDTIEEGSHIFEPMLAQDYKKALKRKNPPIAEKVYSQSKYNGMRCIVNRYGMWSRKGKPIFSAPHIFEALKPSFVENPGLVFDGELYNNDFRDDFNEIISIFRQTKPSKEDLEKSKKLGQYYIYDMTGNGDQLGFGYRFEHLKKQLSTIKDPCIVLVPTVKVTSQKHMDELYAEYLTAGMEGQIIREDAVYENKRTWSLLKRKEFMDAEFELLDILPGLGNWSGKAKRAHLKLPDGREFHAGITGTMEFCTELLKNKADFIGKPTTVNFFQYTPDGVPLFPRCKEFGREDATDSDG